MMIATNSLAEVAGRSATLSERLRSADLWASPADPGKEQEQVEQTRAALEKWRETAASGDEVRFGRRLQALGLDWPTAQTRLASSAAPDTAQEWLGLLEEVLAVAPTCRFEAEAVAGVGGGNAAEALPFEEVLRPFVRVARRRLEARGSLAGASLTSGAWADLERGLLRSLTALAARPLWLEFAVWRASRSFGLFLATFQKDAPGPALPVHPASRTLYTRFATTLLEGGLADFCGQYSTLARLLARRTLNWIEANAEFLQRLRADRELLAALAGGASSPVVALQTGLSDPHCGGREVLALTFQNGARLVYKPRNLAAEASFQSLLEWCNRQDLSLDFKTTAVLNRGTHGWVGFVPARPCQNEGENLRYYRRTGMLLALLYLLHGTDYHYQNILGCGEYPVAIDQEGLLYPQVRAGAGEEAEANLAYREFSNTVLRTGLLPAWESRSEGTADVSALGGGAAQGRGEAGLVWEEINTDRMRWHYGAVARSEQGDPASPKMSLACMDEFGAGFRETYRLLLRNRAPLTAPGGPLEAFAHLPTRFIFRNTEIYGSLLRNAQEPQFLKDGLDRSLQLERASRAFLQNELPAAYWPILEAELAALEALDIPMLAVRSDSTALYLETGQSVPDFFTMSGYDLVRESFAGWGEDDLARQLGYIRAALYAKNASGPLGTSPEEGSRRASPVGGAAKAKAKAKQEQAGAEAVARLSADQLVEEALKLGLALEKEALRSGGRATWIYLGYDKRLNHYRLNPLDNSLYSGLGGVALFLAALARFSGEARFAELARAALQPLQTGLAQPGSADQFARRQGLGGGLGLGSLIYSLTRCGQFLGDESLVELARRAASFDRAEIERDESYDLIFGTAGAVLSLLALYDLTGDPATLAQATRCGEHLRGRAVQGPSGGLAWPTLSGKLAAGYSHGAAGIAYALLRLAEATGQAEFRQTAAAAIEYEASLFDRATGNWPHYAGGAGTARFWTTWCHGAPGIVLARMAGLPLLDTPAIRQDIRRGLETTTAHGLGQIDHLCCGNFGRIETLLMAGDRLDDPASSHLAQTWAARRITQARQGTGYALFPDAPGDLYSPSFFQGTSGLGYTLLRLADPQKLPSVLLWQ